MRVIIIGAGRRGCALAEYLIGENADVVMIDNDERKIERAKDRVDCMAILGNGNDIQVLADAAIQDADYFVALTDSDEVNLISCAIAESRFGLKNTLCCVKNISYASKGSMSGNLFGIGRIVNPEEEAANSICNAIERGLYSNVISFEDSDLSLYNIDVDGMPDEMKGKTLMQLRNGISGRFVVGCILRGTEVIIPSGQTAMLPGDLISVVVSERDAASMLKKFGLSKPRPKRIIFHGLNQTSDHILSSLSPSVSRRVVLIDKDKSVCERFSAKYSDNIVLNANLMNDDILEEENLTGYDLFVALEDSDELNTILAHFAKRKGVRHSIALCKREDGSALRTLDIDMVVSATQSAVSSLCKFFRAQGNVRFPHSIFGGRIEVAEISIGDGCPVLGKRLNQIDVRQKAIVVGARKSDGKSIIPDGNLLLENGDRLMALVMSNRRGEVRRIFSSR